MVAGGFNSLSKFELFIWDLEIFLQLQEKLGDKIILKGGAATQFYTPVKSQRTSIDIDMICLASREEVGHAIAEIENALGVEGDHFKFRLHSPKKPKLSLNKLETYFQTVPSICNEHELFTTKGQQEVKIEFFYSRGKYEINKFKFPKLFALETEKEFNILAFESLFADKLTTLGPTTIGISDERSDEQVKQIYDVITLLVSNLETVIKNKQLILIEYKKMALAECQLRNLEYDNGLFMKDMKSLVDRLKNIESNSEFLQKAYDFQVLYLRKPVNRDKAEWAIVGYQLELLFNYLFQDGSKLLAFREIEELITTLKFEHINGPERGKLIKEIRNLLEINFGSISELSRDIFKKRMDRIIWELVTMVDLEEIKGALDAVV